jgi:hypothetical protein
MEEKMVVQTSLLQETRQNVFFIHSFICNLCNDAYSVAQTSWYGMKGW